MAAAYDAHPERFIRARLETQVADPWPGNTLAILKTAARARRVPRSGRYSRLRGVARGQSAGPPGWANAGNVSRQDDLMRKRSLGANLGATRTDNLPGRRTRMNIAAGSSWLLRGWSTTSATRACEPCSGRRASPFSG